MHSVVFPAVKLSPAAMGPVALALTLSLLAMVPAPGAARADCVLPDLQICTCHVSGGQWPLLEIPGDVVGTAHGSVGARTSCLVHRGQPYWQIQLQVDHPDLAHLLAHWAPNTPVNFPAQAWCTETIAFWHREAQVPYPEGYQSFLWPTTYVQNVNALRTWYVAEDFWRTEFGGNTRGRWVSGSELDYDDFIPGVNGPCPGAYQALENYDPWKEVWTDSGFHSQLVDSVFVHRLGSQTGPVQTIDVHVVDGNAGGGQFNDIYGDPVSCGLVRDTAWYRNVINFTALCEPPVACGNRRIRGWGIDLNADGSTRCDESRMMTYVTHYVAAHPLPAAPDDPDVEMVGMLMSYRVATGGTTTVTTNASSIQTGGALPSRLNHWIIPQAPLGVDPAYIQVDFRAEHPAPVRGVVVDWKEGICPRNYQVWWAGADGVMHTATVSSTSTVAPPSGIPSMPLPTAFGPSPPFPVRYLRLVFASSALTRPFEITGLSLLFDYGLPDDDGDVFDDTEDFVGVDDAAAPIPGVRLLPARPNPSSGPTAIQWEQSGPETVELRIYTPSGAVVRRVEGLRFGPGVQTWLWDGRDEAGRDVRSGIYFLEIRSATGHASRSMVVVR